MERKIGWNEDKTGRTIAAAAPYIHKLFETCFCAYQMVSFRTKLAGNLSGIVARNGACEMIRFRAKRGPVGTPDFKPCALDADMHGWLSVLQAHSKRVCGCGDGFSLGTE